MTSPSPLQPGPWGVPGVAPQAQPPAQQAPASSGAGGGFFSRIGQTLKQVMPYITPIANRLAAAAGNYGPIELEHQQREDALKQQLGQSQMDTANLNRQLLTKQISNVRTPEQQADAAADLRQRENEDAKAYEKPTDIVAQTDSGGMGHFQQKWNPATKAYETTPTMVQGPDVANPTQAPGAGMAPPTMPPLVKPSANVTPAPHQLQAMAKPISAGGDIEPDQNSPTGFSRVWRGANFAEVHREAAPAPTAYVGSTTSGTNTVLKDDGHGNMVPVALPHSATKTPTPLTKPQVPGVTPAPAASNPQAPPSANPRSNLGVRVGAPVLDAKAPKIVTDAYNTVQDSTSRYNIMQENLKAATTTGDQQAMLSLLTNHIGMTLGLQKGARITQAILQEAQQSAPWLQAIGAKFDNRGFLSGVTLTPEQMTSMVDLAKNRLAQDNRKYLAVQTEAKRGFQSGTPDAATPAPGGKWNPVKGVYE